ncbi:MAG TPA: hypothetical protein VFV17_04275 [Usitatibacteraceae bacterium]|nr:hypothetical protein [Usitatibacteraceae bacterium]
MPWTSLAAERPIHELRGSVSINGKPATKDSVIAPGDVVTTGSDGHVVFVIGDSAFMLRSRSEFRVERPKEDAFGALYGVLRLVSGALGATFRKGGSARLVASNATIGIRGTGIYLETRGNGVYFCTCWGSTEVMLTDQPAMRERIEATRHSPRLVALRASEPQAFMPAPFETHTDQEMEILEKCVARKAPWVK